MESQEKPQQISPEKGNKLSQKKRNVKRRNKRAAAKKGRPSKAGLLDIPIVKDSIRMLYEQGKDDLQVAAEFFVDLRTLENWKTRNVEFLRSVKTAKEDADQNVENSLYQNAMGFSYIKRKSIKEVDGKHEVEVEWERVKPDTRAQMFWLMNRKPRDWRPDRDQGSGNQIRPPTQISFVRETPKPDIEIQAAPIPEKDSPNPAGPGDEQAQANQSNDQDSGIKLNLSFIGE